MKNVIAANTIMRNTSGSITVLLRPAVIETLNRADTLNVLNLPQTNARS